MSVMPAAAVDPRETSKTDRVYAHMRRRIRELALPPGAPLRKEELALELGVSRAPVSEAIARLAEEGLVEVFPQHGSFVAPIRAADVRESLFIRAALEAEAMRRLATHADAALMARLDENLGFQSEALADQDLARFYDLDEALHGLLFAAVESPRATRILDAARAPLDRVRRLALPEPGRPEATFAEHLRLVEAVRSGDPEFAAAAMRVHLAMVGRTVERELAKMEETRDPRA
ncbi:MAG TPA: GntR family transcriptional regulator [Caulobacteraceae bacterium]|jgi:DNA-binding GntR family transcriptional regulator